MVYIAGPLEVKNTLHPQLHAHRIMRCHRVNICSGPSLAIWQTAYENGDCNKFKAPIGIQSIEEIVRYRQNDSLGNKPPGDNARIRSYFKGNAHGQP